jgi:hypothetical protein
MKCRNERREFSYNVVWRYVKLWDFCGDLSVDETLSKKFLSACV